MKVKFICPVCGYCEHLVTHFEECQGWENKGVKDVSEEL